MQCVTSDRAQRGEHRRERSAPPQPEPLPRPVLDSHVHLDIVGSDGADSAPAPEGSLRSPRLFGVREQIEAARSVGVDRLVQVGVDLVSSRWSVTVADEEPSVVATVSLHPNEAPRLGKRLDEALDEIADLAKHPRVRGVGETGLDFFRTTGDDELAAQERSFRAHIAIAKAVGKPLVIHDRDAHADILRVLDEEGAPQTVVLHCFSGDGDFAAECVSRGYVLSFAGTVTFKNASGLRDAARLTPLSQMLVETDAPYLTPMPHRGAPNASYLIPLTVRGLASVKEMPVEEVCDGISATGERVFGPWA
jgi:TatD DNase family protein